MQALMELISIMQVQIVKCALPKSNKAAHHKRLYTSEYY